MKQLLVTLAAMVWVGADQLQAQCTPDTVFTDVIYLIDNSGSIDPGEYASFENIITTSIASLQSNCSEAQVAVAHYGGFEGKELSIERPFSLDPVTSVNRQFCTERDTFILSPTDTLILCSDGGGDDLNFAIGHLIDSMEAGVLTHDTTNNLSLVILTDAFGFSTNCLTPACSQILPIDNIDDFKATYGVDVTVVGISAQAEESLLGIYASPGGTFNGPLWGPGCTGTFDDCDVPRKYIQTEFNADPAAVANIISNTVSCQIQVFQGVAVDAGMDQSICTDLGQMATLTATPAFGTPPYNYIWSNGAGNTQSVTVSPSDTTTYFVSVTDVNNCPVPAVDSITVFAAPCCVGFSVNAGADDSVCSNMSESTNITASASGGTPPYTYSWDNGLGAGASQTVTPTSTTTYTVTATDAIGCTTTDQVVVTATVCCTGFSADAGADVTICGDLSQSTTLTVTPSGGTSPYTATWNNGGGSGLSVSVTPTVTTTYTVTLMDNAGCSTTDQVVVTVEDCCTGFMVDAGLDTTICGSQGLSVNLMAMATGSGSSFSYAWDNGLGSGASQVVMPNITTTYSVTASDNIGCMDTDQVTVTVESCGPDCVPDTAFADVIFLIDNSGSIDASEFSAFENIILSSLNGIQNSCPLSRRAVVHYGGLNGTSTTVEHSLSNASINSINRQFCTSLDINGFCVGGGGDDLNNAIGDIITFLDDGTLNRDPNNTLSLVILTDAFSFDQTCPQPNCSLILPTTNIDLMKANYGVDVSVIGVSAQAEESLLGIYASPGGSFQGPLSPAFCPGSFDGCEVPRKYVQVEFNTPPQNVADMIVDFVSCTVSVTPVVDVEAGDDQTICGNLGESATISASSSFGVAPFIYTWDNGLGTGSSFTVTPSNTTTYIVTVTDANMCTAIDSVTVNVQVCEDCIVDAGTPLPPAEICIEEGQAFLSTDSNTDVQIPIGFEEVFILTNQDLVIIDFSIGFRNFIVTEPGLYRIHTLIAEVSNPADPDFLDLNIIEPGSSELFLIVNCIENHDICAAFDFPGRVWQVLGEDDMRCMEFENSINLCWDGVDNDGDGLIDCADPDCVDIITCLENTLIACNDLTDNDGDGLVDCFDPDCFGFTLCFERGEQCEDGIDNDGDGLIDCADSSCDGSEPCLEDNPFNCVDGRDNDGDGLVDCADPDCQSFIVCDEFDAVACKDGVDNDRDGLVDCLDPDCRAVLPEYCEPYEDTVEKCSDGRDNDFDGLVDCLDPDCRGPQLDAVLDNLDIILEVTNATCMGGDNGIIRFFGIAQDPSFQYSINGSDFISSFQFTGLAPDNYTMMIRSALGCIEFFNVVVERDVCPEICNNNIDDDGDGLVDCDDIDCNIVEPFDPDIVNIIPADCPDFNNGGFTVAGLPSDVQYTIDGGLTYQSSPTFTGLSNISYNLGFLDARGCHHGVIVTVPKGLDADDDNICDDVDRCPGVDDWIIGSACDDGNPNTENDVFIDDCSCAGTPRREICNNGIDDDGDGLIDCMDEDCCADQVCAIPAILFTTTPVGCDGLPSGRIIISNFDPTLVYRLQSGEVFNTSTASFDNLMEGSYMVMASSSCASVVTTPITIGLSTSCTEICGNGLDDDGDGLIDCSDDDCQTNAIADLTVVNSGCDEQSGRITINNYDPERQYFIDAIDAPLVTEVNGVFSNLVPATYMLYGLGLCDTIEVDDIVIGVVGGCTEICNNGADDDGDGLIDCTDSDCTTNLAVNTTVTPSQCGASTGSIAVVDFNAAADYILTTSSGASLVHSSIGIFEGLAIGTYTLTVVDGCNNSEITIRVNGDGDCGEICDNGLDDDGDGLVDCADDDCRNTIDTGATPSSSECNGSTGSIEIVNYDPSVEYVLTGPGMPARRAVNPIFSEIAGGSYVLFAIGVCDTVVISDIIVEEVGCSTGSETEICDNGIDDDGDGLVDCADDGCATVCFTEQECSYSIDQPAFEITIPSGVTLDSAIIEVSNLTGSEPSRFSVRSFNGFETISINENGRFSLLAAPVVGETLGDLQLMSNIDDVCGNPGEFINFDWQILFYTSGASGDNLNYTGDFGENLSNPANIGSVFNGLNTVTGTFNSNVQGSGILFYRDFDEDGFGDINGDPIALCPLNCEPGYVDNNLDCDDMNGTINPNNENCDSSQIQPDCTEDFTLSFATADSDCDGMSASLFITDYDPDAVYRLTGSGSTFGEQNGIFDGLAPGFYDLFGGNSCDSLQIDQIELFITDGCQEVAEGVTESNETLSLDIRVRLEGATEPFQELMSTELNDEGYLPGQVPSTFFGSSAQPGQPYIQAPWFYDGTEGLLPTNASDREVYQYDEDVVDWILVSLRVDQSKSAEVWKAAAWLHSDGRVTFFEDPDIPASDRGYYIVIEHRNHLPVMSHINIYESEGLLSYNFTSQDSYHALLGIGQLQSDLGEYMMVAGNGDMTIDPSSDIDINTRDLSQWILYNGANSSYFFEDYDMNGDVNIKDRILWEKNNGLFTTIETK